jgi:hypothetical protein
MNAMNVRWKMVGVAIGIVVVIVIAIFWIISLATSAKNFRNAGSTANASTTVTNVAPGGSSSTASAVPPPSGTMGSAGSIPALPGPSITIHLLTPISGNAWTIGGTNSIAWDNPAGITGEIDLVNANTKAFIGVILSETGPNQTSYSWDARSISLARYSADQENVVPGTYSIRIHFDGNGLGDLVSGPITITD